MSVEDNGEGRRKVRAVPVGRQVPAPTPRKRGEGAAVPAPAPSATPAKREPTAKAFTTQARGGTSWAAASGGLSLRKQREAQLAAEREQEQVAVPRPGGAAVPAPAPSTAPAPSATPAPAPAPAPMKKEGSLPGRAVPVAAPGAAGGRGKGGAAVPAPSPVSADSGEEATQGETGGLPAPKRAASSGEVVEDSTATPSRIVTPAPKKVFIPTPQSTPDSFVGVADDWEEVEEEEVNERRVRAMSAASKRGIRITPRDIVIIRFLARYRYAAHHQVARYIGTSEKATSIRLHKLAEGKIVHKVEITHGRNVWTPTADGIAIADVDMPFIRPQDIALSTMAHELGLVNLGIELELGGDNVLQEDGWPHLNRYDEDSDEPLPGERVLTTREIKQASMRFRKGTNRYEIMAEYKARMDAWDPSEGYPSPELLPGNEGMFVMYSDEYGDHLPDMVVMRDREADGSPRSVAIELELSRKPEKDLIRILQNFKESLLFDKLYYFCHKKSVATALMRVNKREVGIPDENFKVLRYFPTKSKDPFWG